MHCLSKECQGREMVLLGNNYVCPNCRMIIAADTARLLQQPGEGRPEEPLPDKGTPVDRFADWKKPRFECSM